MVEINFNYNDISHTIHITEKDAKVFEKRFFPLNKYSILTIIPDETPDGKPFKIEDEDVEKYVIDAIEECVFN